MYEEYADVYARHTAHSKWNSLYERPALQKAIGEVRSLAVLDAGCASGELSAWLVSQGAQVTALDKSAAFIEMIEKRFGDHVRACRADLEHALPFPESSFDIVVSSLSLHYVADWNALMPELFRLTKPGGRLLFSTHHPESTGPMVANYFETSLVDDVFTIEGKKYPVQFYHRPLHDILNSVLKAGFAISAVLEPVPLERPERPWFLIVECARPR